MNIFIYPTISTWITTEKSSLQFAQSAETLIFMNTLQPELTTSLKKKE